jgi:hypothetical protein
MSAVDGAQLGQSFDGYHSSVSVNNKLGFGSVQLSAGAINSPLRSSGKIPLLFERFRIRRRSFDACHPLLALHLSKSGISPS